MAKYFWLKLQKDFFKRTDIRIIEAMPNGKDYILFYLKLLCESVDRDGRLRFSDKIPLNEEMLATLTLTNIDIVRSAIKIFTELSMMEILDDGTYYMTEVDKITGSETEWAEKKRQYREKIGHIEDNVLEKKDNVLDVSSSCPIRDRERERPRDRERLRGSDNSESVYNTSPSLARENPSGDSYSALSGSHTYGLYNNVILTDEEFSALTLDYPHEYKDMIENLSAYMKSHGKSYADHYATLCDWKRKDDAKKYQKPINKTAQELDDFYERAQNWAEGD